MSFSFLDSFFAFVEHIPSDSLRKHLGGKSFEVAQVCALGFLCKWHINFCCVLAIINIAQKHMTVQPTALLGIAIQWETLNCPLLFLESNIKF